MSKKLLVYIHIPFCNSKCHFCDWVHEIPVSQLRLKSSDQPRKRYILTLADQIRCQGAELKAQGYTPNILYWGGGTASILNIEEISIIATALNEAFDFSSVVEKTIECSPETLSPEKLKTFYEFGFKRISIGLQSMNEKTVRYIGRAHSRKEGIDAVNMAKDAGFEEINIDLISGFPNEPTPDFKKSLLEALEMPVTHFSVYPYRPTPGTVMNQALRKGRYSNISLDSQLNSYQVARKILTERGFPEYAVSHFGNVKCLSDLAYFQLQMDWVGFGSGATSLLNQQFMMTSRGKLHDYLQDNRKVDHVFPASSSKITSRLMFQSLATFEGASESNWKERTGASFNEILQQPEIRGLIGELKQYSSLNQEDENIWFEPDLLAESYIHLLFKSVPKEARELKLNNIIGTY